MTTEKEKEPLVSIREVVATEKEVEPSVLIPEVVTAEKEVEHSAPFSKVVVAEKEVEPSILVLETVSPKSGIPIRRMPRPLQSSQLFYFQERVWILSLRVQY